MRTAATCALTLLAFPAIALVWEGCQAVAVSGEAYTPVYGDYGYVGPWDRGRVEVEGAYLVAPPYGHPDEGRRDGDNRGREAPPPERSRTAERPTPVQHAPSRALPSIPNNPRPAPQRGGNDKNRR